MTSVTLTSAFVDQEPPTGPIYYSYTPKAILYFSRSSSNKYVSPSGEPLVPHRISITCQHRAPSLFERGGVMFCSEGILVTKSQRCKIRRARACPGSCKGSLCGIIHDPFYSPGLPFQLCSIALSLTKNLFSDNYRIVPSLIASAKKRDGVSARYYALPRMENSWATLLFIQC